MGGKLFAPEWAVTNYARVYSLWCNRWLTPQATGTRRYWHVVGEKQPAVHELVVNYFRDESDQIALEEFGEDGIEVQHQIPIAIPDNLKNGNMNNRDERIQHCMKCNCKSNVFYQKKEHNRGKDRLITKGLPTEEEQAGKEVWSDDMKTARTMFANSGKCTGDSNGARVIYYRDTEGNLKETISMVLNMKGSLLDADTVVEGEYKINGGAENVEFIKQHMDEVLEAIKTYPPKSRSFERGKCFDGRCIYYALR